MIETEVYARVRALKARGISMRKAAEALGLSRNTVKKYWDGAHTPDERKNYPVTVESASKKTVMAALKKYFEETREDSFGKQQVTAKTAWVALRDTFIVGESTVRRYVRELKAENPEAFVPLAFSPAEVMQVDWCEIKVNIRGHLWKVPVFCAVLPYSYAIFAMVMPNMKLPCFIEGHTQAFEFFGGVPERVFYDNLRTAALSGTGKNVVKQERFRMLEAHYAFEAVFMNADAGNEKGSVENLCGLIRLEAFTPIPKGESLKDIQDLALERCLAYNKFHKIKDRKRPVAEMFSEERCFLRALPIKPFSAYEQTEAHVGTDMTFRYDATKYSLPMEYVGKIVTVRIFSYRIEAWHKGTLVFTHSRPFAKGEHQYIPEHYLPLLLDKPRSIGNAAPLRIGVMPKELDEFRRSCTAKDKYEQLAKILLLAQKVETKLLLYAVDYANKTGIPTYEKVCLYLELHEISVSANVSDPITVDRQGLERYDDLWSGKDGKDE